MKTVDERILNALEAGIFSEYEECIIFQWFNRRVRHCVVYGDVWDMNHLFNLFMKFAKTYDGGYFLNQDHFFIWTEIINMSVDDDDFAFAFKDLLVVLENFERRVVGRKVQ